MTAPETRAPPPSVPSQTSQGEQRIQDGGVCRGIYAESLTAGRVDKRATCVRAQRFVNSQHVCACQCSKRRGANHITRDHWWDDLRRVCTCACLFVRVCSLPLCVCVWGGREREEREYPICVLEHVLASKASAQGGQAALSQLYLWHRARSWRSCSRDTQADSSRLRLGSNLQRTCSDDVTV